MSDLASKMYLFGLGALLSLNYYQGSIYTAIFTYFNMTAIIVLVAANLISSVNESIMTKIYLVFYSLLFMWYMGIMIDYFTTWKSVWNGEVLINIVIFAHYPTHNSIPMINLSYS